MAYKVNDVTVIMPLIMSTALVASILGLVWWVAVFFLKNKPLTPAQGDCLPRKPSWHAVAPVIELGSIGFWLIVTGLHLAGWHLYFRRDTGYDFNGMTYLFSYLSILLGWQLWLTTMRTRSAIWAMMNPLGMRLLQVLGLSCCISLLSVGTRFAFPQALPGELVVVKTVRTDAGTPIPLYERRVESKELEEYYVATQLEVSTMAKQAMLRESAAAQVNCHGWVFSGQHTIKGEDVATILKENGYKEVDQPQLQDLVIYSDAYGSILHTGLVCGFFGEDRPLIQSKWGITGVYVHMVDEQPYSTAYRFYRSARDGGHALKTCEPLSTGPMQDLAIDQASDDTNDLASGQLSNTKPRVYTGKTRQRLATLLIGESPWNN